MHDRWCPRLEGAYRLLPSLLPRLAVLVCECACVSLGALGSPQRQPDRGRDARHQKLEALGARGGQEGRRGRGEGSRLEARSQGQDSVRSLVWPFVEQRQPHKTSTVSTSDGSFFCSSSLALHRHLHNDCYFTDTTGGYTGTTSPGTGRTETNWTTCELNIPILPSSAKCSSKDRS
ncbi:hypothetical protein FPQ18DRAFT_84193 [Pyronema domesticum]|nr:hypothetical protein FPQ18DRAFT_84193 [Pyronema domesticum]